MSKTYYIHGNTIRELEEAQPVRRERRSREEIERANRRKARRNAARRNREKAYSMSMGYVGFLSVCVLLCVFAAFSLIKMQAQITSRMQNVAVMETKTADIKAENDAKYKEITTSVDMDKIKKTAMKKYGMKYASKKQVVYYTVNTSNYMDQYGDIPE